MNKLFMLNWNNVTQQERRPKTPPVRHLHRSIGNPSQKILYSQLLLVDPTASIDTKVG